LQLWQDKPLLREDTLSKLSKEAFTLHLPNLRPNSVNEFIKFLKTNAAVTTLREELLRQAVIGGSLDQHWGRSVREEAARALLTQEKRGKRLRFYLMALKLAPVPDFSILGELAGELLTKGGEIAGERTIEEIYDHQDSNSAQKFKWYYTLLEISKEH
jgi:hypothetical protein